MSTTLEQQIAKKESELARLKAKNRKLDTGQKVVIGGAVLAYAKNNNEFARGLISILETTVTRKADSDRLVTVIDKLKNDLDNNCITEKQRLETNAIYSESDHRR